MKLRRSLHTNKGYTLIELMITLFIFAIITMFGVPAFYDFIEQSRAKSQLTKAANFLRSAQEIATSTNRIVYVYTEGYFDYDHNRDQDTYWYKDWIMSFKPIGHNNTTITEQDIALRTENNGVKKANPNYLISQQRIFTESPAYALNVLTSSMHNAIDRKKIGSSDNEMEGYSLVRETPAQGSVANKPTYLVFRPSGAMVLPVFVLTKEPLTNLDFYTNIDTKMANALGVLAGCRIGGGLTIDVINYTFNQSIIQNPKTFEQVLLDNSRDTSGSPPSFSQHICGSKFLQ
ncbi:pilus assembly FimT family protein [Wohlfahrtiimonas larvae]|uniref:Prepilin-type N-terminal cleavage/methylation domain-containing protein n=1 Tax=Wohlfahrtiimonas larvae TaxID=1157986 RepID=A0ABP9MWF8_9GAMM|nr:prepilin-type N-terminal cleavage/methylation domain-containing protein [Wohlfahrtiimonas larvae]